MGQIVYSSIGTICIAAIALSITLALLVFYIKKPEYRWNLWASFISISAMIYAIAVFIQYNTPAGFLNQLSDRIQFTAIILLVHCEFGYTLSYLELKKIQYHTIASIIHTFFLISLWTTDLIISNSIIAREFACLPMPYIEYQTGLLGQPFFLFFIIESLSCIVVWIKKRTPGDINATAFISGIFFWSLLGIHDALASMGMRSIQFLMEYGVLGLSTVLLTITLKDYLRRIQFAEEQSTRLNVEKERLMITLRSIIEGVITIDAGGSISLMNHSAESITGWDETDARGKDILTVLKIYDEETGKAVDDPVEKCLSADAYGELKSSLILKTKDNLEKQVTISAAPVVEKMHSILGYVLVIQDITEKRKIEIELLKSSKIDSIGILAGGIAHDFNNILTSILGNIEIAMMSLKTNDTAADVLNDAKHASLHARELTQQLLTFSRGGDPVKHVLQLKPLMKEIAGFTLSGSNTVCSFSVPDNLWPVFADEGQINQVLSNILLNAKQSMPEGGTIKVSAENIPPQQIGNLPLNYARHVRIIIKDEGSGITKENLHKIFDPYFTTKETGNGLGLAVSWSIVKKHDGIITVDSAVGSGSSFSIYLPVSEETKQSLTDTRSATGIEKGAGNVLLMDDDESIRRTGKRLIEHLGYAVETAADGEEALDIYQEAISRGVPYDIVIMDLTIPGKMGGKEAIKKLLEIDKNVTALVSSGYSNDPVMSYYGDYGFKGVVPKPYDIDELKVALHKAMEDCIK